MPKAKNQSRRVYSLFLGVSAAVFLLLFLEKRRVGGFLLKMDKLYIGDHIQYYTARVSKMDLKKVTLNVDKEIYDDFKSYCKSNGLVVSKTVEKFMLLKIRGKENGQ